MTVFGLNDSWQACADACRHLDSTRPDFDPDESACPIVSLARSFGDVTMAEGLDMLAASESGHALNLMVWMLLRPWAIMSDAVHDRLIAAIARDPAAACLVYVRQPDLTDAQDAVLWAAFETAIPNMARRLMADPRRRAKVRMHG